MKLIRPYLSKRMKPIGLMMAQGYVTFIRRWLIFITYLLNSEHGLQVNAAPYISFGGLLIWL